MTGSKTRIQIWCDPSTAPSPRLSELAYENFITPIEVDWQAKLEISQPFLLLVDAHTGVSKVMIEQWQFVAERQLPRILLVQGLEDAESDFDDLVLIANRVLEKVATPYLVINDEAGAPIGLVDLKTQTVRNYQDSNLQISPCDDSLIDLIDEFRAEYLEEFDSLGETAFAEGMYPIALPFGITKPFGVIELNQILATLPRR